MNLEEAKKNQDENMDNDRSGGEDPDAEKTTRKWWGDQVYETKTERTTITETEDMIQSEDTKRSDIFLDDGEIYNPDDEPSAHVWCTVHQSVERFILLRSSGQMCFAGHWCCKYCSEIEEGRDDQDDVVFCHQHADDHLMGVEQNHKRLVQYKLTSLVTDIFSPRKRGRSSGNQRQIGPGRYDKNDGRKQQSAPKHTSQKKR